MAQTKIQKLAARARSLNGGRPVAVRRSDLGCWVVTGAPEAIEPLHGKLGSAYRPPREHPDGTISIHVA